MGAVSVSNVSGEWAITITGIPSGEVEYLLDVICDFIDNNFDVTYKKPLEEIVEDRHGKAKVME